MNRHFILPTLGFAALLALGACTAAQLASAPVTVTTVLTDAAKAACAGQAAANVATDALTLTHNTDAAAKASQASALLGVACAW